MNTPAPVTTTAPALCTRHIDRIAAAAEASHSPATLRNYRAAQGLGRQAAREGPAERTESRSQALRRGLADVEFKPDGSARLTVRRSKTDPEGAGAVQYVGPGAAKALREMIQPREELGGRARVFGLKSGRAVSNRIAAAAKAARLDGRFSGHSPTGGERTLPPSESGL